MSTNNDFKQTLWKTADSLRAQMDAAEYKHIVLGLIFLKYISDTFEAQQEKVRQMVSDPDSEYFISETPEEYQAELEERDYYIQDNVFWVPQEARWSKLRAQAKQMALQEEQSEANTPLERMHATCREAYDRVHEKLSTLRELKKNLSEIKASHFKQQLIEKNRSTKQAILECQKNIKLARKELKDVYANWLILLQKASLQKT